MQMTADTTSAVDLLTLSLWMFAGVILGVLVTFIITVIVRMLSHKHEILGLAVVRVRVSAYIFMSFMGAGLGFEYALEDLRNLPIPPKWVLTSEHVLLIFVILTATWMGVKLVGVVEDVARHFSRDSKGGRGMRVVTQAQILSRIVQAIVVTCGIAGVVLTFPQARLIAGSLLASAGVLSIVAGMAAQSSLSNMFAGIQIAISDSLRVGDIVVVDNNGQPTQATIEEITLTYIVVRIWDDRRIIIPSLKFTQNSFENWTRRAATLMGTVEIDVDWSISVINFRRQVDKLLTSTDLWDGRSFNVQVTDTIDNKLTIRVSISAKNAGDLWDLRCYLRENLVEWIKNEQPHAIPKTNVVVGGNENLISDTKFENISMENNKFEIDNIFNTNNNKDSNINEVKEAKFLIETLEKTKRKNKNNEKSKNKDQDKNNQQKDNSLSFQEEKGKGKKNKLARKSFKDKSKLDKAEKARVADLEETQVMTASQIRQQFLSISEIQSNVEEKDTETSLAMERLYSGSPENEERAKIFDGPGAEVIEEREKTAQLHTRDIDDLERKDEDNLLVEEFMEENSEKMDTENPSKGDVNLEKDMDDDENERKS